MTLLIYVSQNARYILGWFQWRDYLPVSFTTHAPPKYNPKRGAAKSIWVKGSVDGVSTAAATTAPTTTYLQIDSIWSLETKPTCPSSSCITGTCKQKGYTSLENGILIPLISAAKSQRIREIWFYLERQSCAKHQHKHKLKVLINRPQGFHNPFSIIYKESQGSRSEDKIWECNARIEENWGSQDNWTKKSSFCLCQTRNNKSNDFIQNYWAS